MVLLLIQQYLQLNYLVFLGKLFYFKIFIFSSAGLLKLTGYTCDVLGVRSVCALRENPTNEKNKNSTTEVHNYFTVQVLRSLPLLQLETSLKRAPLMDETVEAIAEATVFSGQTLYKI